jgi:hypothetical protein
MLRGLTLTLARGGGHISRSVSRSVAGGGVVAGGAGTGAGAGSGAARTATPVVEVVVPPAGQAQEVPGLHKLQAALKPREVVDELDKFIVGQGDAKRAVAIALRNR